MSTATSTALRAEVRDDRGKGAAGRLRREGKLPAILYGAGKEPLALSIDAHDFSVFRQHILGQTVLFELEIDGQGTHQVFIKDMQRDPVTDIVTHVDLLRTDASKTVALPLRIVQTGIAPEGVRAGGILERHRFEVLAEALPGHMPRLIEADLSNLGNNANYKVADLPQIDGVKYLDDADTVLFLVRSKAKASKEDKATDAAAAGAAATAAATAAAAPAAKGAAKGAAAPAAKGAAKAAAPAAKGAAKK